MEVGDEIRVAKRPDSGGTMGQVIPLHSNHFLVRFEKSQQIFHYDFNIFPNASKQIARAIKNKLVQTNQIPFSSAFDGRRNLYTPIKFQSRNFQLFVTLPIPNPKNPSTPDNHRLFRIDIKLVSTIDGERLSKHLLTNNEDKTGYCSCYHPVPQDYIQALDIVLRQAPSENYIPTGKSFYSSSIGSSEVIGNGAIGLRGFFQSLRATKQGLSLNVDFSVAAFHENIGVIPYLQKRIPCFKDPSKGLIGEIQRNDVVKILKNLRVLVLHRESAERYRVQGLSDEVTENLWFERRDGRRVRVVDYFREEYGYEIEMKELPCLQMSRSKACYLPMEVCVIAEGQKFLGKMSDDQMGRMIRMGCQKPTERKFTIAGVVNGLFAQTSGKNGGEFQLQVSKQMTRLNGRVLEPPKLRLGHMSYTTPSRHDRQWDFLSSKVLEGAQIQRWALLSFGGTPLQKSNIPKFTHHLFQKCTNLGIFLAKKPILNTLFEPMHILDNVPLLQFKLNNILKVASNHLQLLICVMEKKHRGYANLKRIAETNVGVMTQCCLYPKLDKLGSQFLSNLALKINAKAGGTTVALYDSLPFQVPRMFNEPVIFMGADVAHPHSLDDSSPSVAAVVGSTNWPAANKYASRMRSQTHRQEIIEELGAMILELLIEFFEETQRLPTRVVFFRDGISETQFKKVLIEEMRRIKQACGELSKDYMPSITFAVVQKRHHTRLFFDDSILGKNVNVNANVDPGTVVDTVITHPEEFDFYLCSHWGGKGTSRPAHYHVLWDESGFTSDEFQKLVYNLCYTFVRCTKPVSLVPPVYYAHLAAYRGRLYLEYPESKRMKETMTRASPPTKARALPELSGSIKKLMFYC